MKSGRVYSLSVVGSHEKHTITYPLTLTFDISRNVMRSANTGTFRIYNLGETTRRDIYFDRYSTTVYRRLILAAGYQSEPKLPDIFIGNITSAFSVREGPNWVTEIQCFDAGFAIFNSRVNTPMSGGYKLRDALVTTLKTMRNCALGKVGEFTEDSSRGIVLSGNSWDVANNLAGQDGHVFADLEKSYALRFDEYLEQGEIPIISADAGLLNSPLRYEAQVDASMLFEPNIIVGQAVKLESLQSVYNGFYKVIGVQHRGTISGAVGGPLTTTLNLWVGTRTLVPI